MRERSRPTSPKFGAVDDRSSPAAGEGAGVVSGGSAGVGSGGRASVAGLLSLASSGMQGGGAGTSTAKAKVKSKPKKGSAR